MISPSPFHVEDPATGGGEGFILKGFTLKETKGVGFNPQFVHFTKCY